LHPGQAQSHGWATSQALRFNVLPTDTTLSVGADMSSTDDKWLRTLSAEQKLFGGPFSVTGSGERDRERRNVQVSAGRLQADVVGPAVSRRRLSEQTEFSVRCRFSVRAALIPVQRIRARAG
jgi:hypothetical protein